MTEYKGRWEAIRGPLIVTAALIALIIYIYVFVSHGFWAYFFIGLLLLFIPIAYSGLILKITINEKKIVIVRPFTRMTVKFEDVALCAVHCVDNGKYLIYAFVKQRYHRGYTVKGIKPKLPFEEVVKRSSKEEGLDLDVNFNRAKKIPVSFVENGQELKDRFMLEVGKYHVKIMEGEE
ncbi:MAG: hypothetical protein GX301_08605 [Gracilibacteraceae bacterium]|nr:hypothetical protein [Gracilibacteraceae bacterium]